MIKILAETRDNIGIGMILNIDFTQDDLEMPNWSRYLQCCLNFKINRSKQTTLDKSVHSVNFSQRNLKLIRGKFLRVISGPAK